MISATGSALPFAQPLDADEAAEHVLLAGTLDGALGRLAQALDAAGLDVVGMELGPDLEALTPARSDRGVLLLISERFAADPRLRATRRRPSPPVTVAVAYEDRPGQVVIIAESAEDRRGSLKQPAGLTANRRITRRFLQVVNQLAMRSPSAHAH